MIIVRFHFSVISRLTSFTGVHKVCTPILEQPLVVSHVYPVEYLPVRQVF